MMKMNDKIKSMIKTLSTKKAILGIILFVTPIVGIAVSPEYAASLAEHLSIILQHVIDMLPAEATEAAADAVSDVPTE